MRFRRFAVLVVAVFTTGLLASASAAEAQTLGLTTGFFGDPVLTTDNAATRAVWIPRAVAEGAGIVRVNVVWSQVAPVNVLRGSLQPTPPARI